MKKQVTAADLSILANLAVNGGTAELTNMASTGVKLPPKAELL